MNKTLLEYAALPKVFSGETLRQAEILHNSVATPFIHVETVMEAFSGMIQKYFKLRTFPFTFCVLPFKEQKEGKLTDRSKKRIYVARSYEIVLFRFPETALYQRQNLCRNSRTFTCSIEITDITRDLICCKHSD